jgi:hypothetical protein
MDYENANGVLPDSRTDEEKAKDFLTKELYAAPAQLVWPTWEQWKARPENIKLLKTLEIQNQNGNYSCMANAGSLIAGIDNYQEEGIYKRFSARSIYPFRRNKPGQGMWTDDLGNIVCSKGVVFEALLPSEKLDEAKMNDMADYLPSYEVLSKIYRAKSYLWIERNIDALAGVLAQNKPALITVVFGNGEWGQAVPVVNPTNTTPYGHGITALPNAYFIYEGKKAVLIQDSWGVESGLDGRRIITEDWFNGRMTSGIWFENLSNLAVGNETQDRPQYTFTRQMFPGMSGADIAQLQRCLGYLKDADGYLFPLAQSPTGYFGGITRQAVKRFQKMNNILETGNVATQTLPVLNSFFR